MSVPVERLSPRQRECLRLAYQRRTTKEIARELGIRPGTVATYCSEAIAILGADNRRHAAELLHGLERAPQIQGGNSAGWKTVTCRWQRTRDLVGRLTSWARSHRRTGTRTMTTASRYASHGSSASPSALRSVSPPSSTPSASSATSSGELISGRLHRYEELLRQAHVAGLELVLDLRRIQADAGLSAITGHGMFARFDEAQHQVSSAIGAAAAGHRLARALGPIAGIDPTAYGENTDPQEDGGRRLMGSQLDRAA